MARIQRKNWGPILDVHRHGWWWWWCLLMGHIGMSRDSLRARIRSCCTVVHNGRLCPYCLTAFDASIHSYYRCLVKEEKRQLKTPHLVEASRYLNASTRGDRIRRILETRICAWRARNAIKEINVKETHSTSTPLFEHTLTTHMYARTGRFLTVHG